MAEEAHKNFNDWSKERLGFEYQGFSDQGNINKHFDILFCNFFYYFLKNIKTYDNFVCKKRTVKGWGVCLKDLVQIKNVYERKCVQNNDTSSDCEDLELSTTDGSTYCQSSKKL